MLDGTQPKPKQRQRWAEPRWSARPCPDPKVFRAHSRKPVMLKSSSQTLPNTAAPGTLPTRTCSSSSPDSGNSSKTPSTRHSGPGPLKRAKSPASIPARASMWALLSSARRQNGTARGPCGHGGRGCYPPKALMSLFFVRSDQRTCNRTTRPVVSKLVIGEGQ